MNETARQNVELFNAPLTPAPNGSGDLMAVIARAASDPNCDVSKMRELLGMHTELSKYAAKKSYYTALAEIQTEIPAIEERGGIKNKANEIQSTYALWEDVNEVIKPILAKYGMALSFRVGFQADKIIVTGVLSHKEGHCEETSIHLPSDTSGSKNAVQAVGSSTSYGKRYTAGALLNLTSRGADDDGKAGGGNGAISEDQAGKIRDLIDRTKADPEKFCQYMKVDAIPDIRVKDYERAITALNLKEKRVQK